MRRPPNRRSSNFAALDFTIKELLMQSPSIRQHVLLEPDIKIGHGWREGWEAQRGLVRVEGDGGGRGGFGWGWGHPTSLRSSLEFFIHRITNDQYSIINSFYDLSIMEWSSFFPFSHDFYFRLFILSLFSLYSLFFSFINVGRFSINQIKNRVKTTNLFLRLPNKS